MSLGQAPSPPPALPASTLSAWLSAVNPITIGISLLVALISTLITSYITHRLTTKRASFEWTRQRMFDVVRQLNAIFDDIQKNIKTYPVRWHETTGNVDLSHLRSRLESVDFLDLINAMDAYKVALSELLLLLPHESTLFDATVAMDAATDDLWTRYRHPYRGYDAENPLSKAQLENAINSAKSIFTSRHQETVLVLKAYYFDPSTKHVSGRVNRA